MSISIGVAVVLVLAAPRAHTESYAIDPARSHVMIRVGKTGVLSFAAGHTHLVSGPIGGRVDRDEDVARSHVRLVIDCEALRVLPDHEPPTDVSRIQTAMDTQVLEVTRYPTITFESTSITVDSWRDNVLNLRVRGRLTMHGITQVVTVPVQGEFRHATLTVTGRFSIRQTDFGISPISIAGVVKVRDELDLRFRIVALVNLSNAYARGR